jgi:DNA polymerase III alpha subunit
MKINTFGQVEISETEAFEALYTKKITDLSSVYVDNENIIDQYNTAKSRNADRIPELQKLIRDQFDSVELFDQANQRSWFMPDDYCPNLVEMLYGMCTTEEQTNRVSQELELFIQHGMFDLLFYLKYLVDIMRENNIVWGVGRGSSVASYVLYLIGIHKVDSIKYELDIHEFLK